MPFLVSSQPCESTFRQIRSSSTVFSTVTNCSVKGGTSLISNVQFQNQIMQHTSEQFIYPRLKNTSHSQNNGPLPSADSIFNEIQLCQKLAIYTALKLGLIAEKKSKENYVCKINPPLSKTVAQLKSTRIQSKNYNQNTNILNNPIVFMATDLKNIQLKNYARKVNPDDINETGPYVEVECYGNRRIIVKKTSLCWLLGSEHNKLSNDRLRRVMHKTHQTSQPKSGKRLYSKALLCSKKRIIKKRKR